MHQPAFAYAAAKWEVEAWLDEFEPQASRRRHRAAAAGDRRRRADGACARRHVRASRRHRRAGVPMPLVWDEDVADAVALALRKDARGAFNLTSEPAMMPRELAQGVRPAPRSACRARSSSSARRWARSPNKLGLSDAIDPAWLRATNVHLDMSSEKARRELGWKPRCPTPQSVINRFLAENSTGLDRRLDLFVRLLQLGARRPLDPVAHMNGRVHLAPHRPRRRRHRLHPRARARHRHPRIAAPADDASSR